MAEQRESFQGRAEARLEALRQSRRVLMRLLERETALRQAQREAHEREVARLRKRIRSLQEKPLSNAEGRLRILVCPGQEEESRG